MNHLAPVWEQFANKIISPDMTPLQIKQLRRCFYAGASILFAIVTEKIDDPHTSREDGAKFMGDLSNEITNFAKDISNGKC